MLALDIFHLRTKFGDSRFSRSRDIIAGIEMKISHVTLTTPFQKRFVTRKLESDTIYLYAKFDNSDFIFILFI